MAYRAFALIGAIRGRTLKSSVRSIAIDTWNDG